VERESVPPWIRGEDGAAPTGRDRSRPEDALRSPAQTRKAIEGERDLLAAALEAADALLIILDDQGRILRVNHAFEVATCYRGGDLRGRDFLDTLPIVEARETFTGGIRSLRAGVATFAFENHWRKSGGERLLANGSLKAVRDSEGGLQSVIVVASDVTQQRATEGELRAAALRDDLTGLYNRRGFALLAERRLVESRRSGASQTLVFADIDHFKAVNDAYGHDAGDRALVLAARALTATFREADIVARIGGDEFAIVADLGSDDDHDLDALSARLEQHIARLLADSDLGFDLALTLGVSYSRASQAISLDELLRQADEFMYERKPDPARDATARVVWRAAQPGGRGGVQDTDESETAS
jgi:diguanylate cyclase (GGDEF)-like protein/PAS domain S-box-containing protein